MTCERRRASANGASGPSRSPGGAARSPAPAGRRSRKGGGPELRAGPDGRMSRLGRCRRKAPRGGKGDGRSGGGEEAGWLPRTRRVGPCGGGRGCGEGKAGESAGKTQCRVERGRASSGSLCACVRVVPLSPSGGLQMKALRFGNSYCFAPFTISLDGIASVSGGNSERSKWVKDGRSSGFSSRATAPRSWASRVSAESSEALIRIALALG